MHRTTKSGVDWLSLSSLLFGVDSDMIGWEQQGQAPLRTGERLKKNYSALSWGGLYEGSRSSGAVSVISGDSLVCWGWQGSRFRDCCPGMKEI